MEKLNIKELDEIKESIIKNLSEKDKTMESQFHRLWSEIENNNLLFNRKEIIIGSIKKIKNKDIIKFFNDYVRDKEPIISCINK